MVAIDARKDIKRSREGTKDDVMPGLVLSIDVTQQ
jgi:hypothetical protein